MPCCSSLPDHFCGNAYNWLNLMNHTIKWRVPICGLGFYCKDCHGLSLSLSLSLSLLVDQTHCEMFVMPQILHSFDPLVFLAVMSVMISRSLLVPFSPVIPLQSRTGVKKTQFDPLLLLLLLLLCRRLPLSSKWPLPNQCEFCQVVGVTS